MPIETILELVTEAIKVTLLISAPLLLTALVVGIIISLFQAVTQIQEMTLTFIPKILATFAALLLTLPWILTTLTDYFHRLFESIPKVIG